MPNWERRDANTLADAINKHRKRNTGLAEDNELLGVVQRALDKAANTIDTTAGTLSRHRALACAICRGSKLYACDVDDGWSENCALIYANASEFSSI